MGQALFKAIFAHMYSSGRPGVFENYGSSEKFCATF
jgi:hypothetical protein